MSDCLIFAVLFATYGVLGASLAGGPGPRDLFELPLVALNTTFLLISSITYGFAMLAVYAKDQAKAIKWLAVTGAFGAAFVAVELYEFAHLIHEGAGPQRSGFLSAFFALVGTHGLHVSFGIVWLVVLITAGAPARADRRQRPAADLPVAVLALPRPRVDRGLHLRLPAGGPAMSAERVLHLAGDGHDHDHGHDHGHDESGRRTAPTRTT